jgi:predicted  nucleic acid-binding Zn-ribbon protein
LQAQERGQTLYAEVQSLRMQVEKLDEARSELEEKLDGARTEAAKVAAARAAEAAAVTKAEGLEVELGTLQEQFKARVNGVCSLRKRAASRQMAFSSICGERSIWGAQALEVENWQKRSEAQQTEASTAAESSQQRIDALTRELTDAKHGLGFLESECNALRGRVGELQERASELQHKVTARIPGPREGGVLMYSAGGCRISSMSQRGCG